MTLQQDTEQIDLEDILKTRLWVYRFLSQSYYQVPTWKLFKPVVSENLFIKLCELDDEETDWNKGLRLLAHSLETIPHWSENQWNDIIQEYQRLFVGPEALPAKPWESVYLSEERIILDEHTLAVREFYRTHGLEMVQLHKEPDDHIGVELEFMAELTVRALNLLQTSKGQEELVKEVLEAQLMFLNEHLLRWVDDFCSLLAQSTEHSFYKGITLFTPHFLRMDAELLADILQLKLG